MRSWIEAAGVCWLAAIVGLCGRSRRRSLEIFRDKAEMMAALSD